MNSFAQTYFEEIYYKIVLVDKKYNLDISTVKDSYYSVDYA